METKKSLKANLEKGKTTNFLMGLVVAISILFVSFEWGTQDVKLFVSDGNTTGIEIEEMMPITRPDTPPPPPPPPAPVVTDVINIVDDTEDVGEALRPTTEDNPNFALPEPPPPPAPIDDEEEGEIDFVVVEKMPEFPGGELELLNFINKSIRYPVGAQERDIQGRVICSFIIDKTGKVVDAQVVRGIDPSLDSEALRVVKTIPNWEPGKQRGKPVRVKYTMPITFRLK